MQDLWEKKSIQKGGNIQEDLDKLQQWSNKWLMKFNRKECKAVGIGRDKNWPNFDYQNTEQTTTVGQRKWSRSGRNTQLNPRITYEKDFEGGKVYHGYCQYCLSEPGQGDAQGVLWLVWPKMESVPPAWSPHITKLLEKLHRYATGMCVYICEFVFVWVFVCVYLCIGVCLCFVWVFCLLVCSCMYI